MKPISDILKERKEEKNKYVSREFQDYGYRLAAQLDDLKHKALYIKLAKKVPRQLLEEAKNFAIDYPKAKSKGKVFMWKLTQLKKEEESDL